MMHVLHYHKNFKLQLSGLKQKKVSGKKKKIDPMKFWLYTRNITPIEACDERRDSSPRRSAWTTHSAETLQRWRAAGNTASDLTGLGIESQTYCSDVFKSLHQPMLSGFCALYCWSMSFVQCMPFAVIN